MTNNKVVIDALRDARITISDLNKRTGVNYKQLQKIDAALALYAEQAPPTDPNEHPDQALFDQYSEIKKKIGKLGYLSFISSKEVEEYREWLRNDRYKHRLEWFEKEYPNGLYSKDEDGDLFGINIITKKFLAEADAAEIQDPYLRGYMDGMNRKLEGQVTGKSAGKQELTDLRNSFYDSMPSSGEIKAWDMIEWAQAMFQEFDVFIDALDESGEAGKQPTSDNVFFKAIQEILAAHQQYVALEENTPSSNYLANIAQEALKSGKQPEQQPADPWIPLKSWDKQGHLEAGKDFLFLYDTGEIRRRDEEEQPFAIITHYMIIPDAPAQTKVSEEQKGE